MTPRTSPPRAWSRGHALAGLAAVLLGATLGACFNPPAADVMFSCDPAMATACPGGYTCEADGCCHREGSDVEADFGGCGIGKGASAGPTTAGPTTAGPTTATTTTATTGAPDTTDAPTTDTAADTGSTGSSSSTGSTSSSSSTGSSGEPDTATSGSGSSSAGTTG